MKTAKWCNAHLNSGALTMGSVVAEMAEVKEAIQKPNWREVREEMADVLYFSYCLLEQRTGISLPMMGAMNTVQKAVRRHRVWQDIFAEHQLAFHPKYLVGGSNYQKKEKVEAAIALAKADSENKLLHIM